MSVLLVLTVGQTDVQLVAGSERKELGKCHCSELHDEIERRAGEWQLVDSPKKFALCTPKLDAVLAWAERQGTVPTAALVLDTRRENVRGDPRYAGAVVTQRLRARGVANVRRVTYLDGRERLEDPGQPRDAIIRREVVGRIDEAVRHAIAQLIPERIVLATTGGPPALELVDKGNALGAWGAVQHLDGDAVEHEWTRVIGWLARFAASLPMPEECDIPVLTHARMTVRAALRVELALRAGDVPRAVHGTVAFFEAALWDHLAKHVTLKDEKSKLYDVQPAPGPSDVKRPFEPVDRDGIRLYKIYDDKANALKLAEEYLKNEPLSQLAKLVNAVRHLRNDVAHNEPTIHLMEKAHETMQGAGLWSRDKRFLTQPPVQAVLQDLGIDRPDRLCEDLTAEVRSRLITWDAVAAPERTGE